MKWLNIHLPDLRSDEFAGVENEQLGIWLRLCAYCCEQENNGFIHMADKWNSRKWLVAVGISQQDIEQPSTLWFFNNVGSLVVACYPLAKQEEIIAKRRAGKRTAKLRWSNKLQSKNSSATSSAYTEGERE